MATYLLKKSYRHKDLKEVRFKDLWDSHGVFTTMWVFGHPSKILFFKAHIKNLIASLKVYNLKKKDIKKNILKLIKINLDSNKQYNHLLRVAIDSRLISISLRKKIKTKSKFSLRLINHKRIKPEFKNLKYKKILKRLSQVNTSKKDVGLVVNKKILESATSNIFFISNNKIYSPISKFYKGTTLKFFEKRVEIIKKNIGVNTLSTYDEIILVGSGKGVVSISYIEKPYWKRKNLKIYTHLYKIYSKAVTNCPLYNG